MTPEQEWMQAWRIASVELPKIRDAELRELDENAGLDLLGASETNMAFMNGLVVQQAWFTRFHLLQLQAELAKLKSDS